jgi:hypothetical protein
MKGFLRDTGFPSTYEGIPLQMKGFFEVIALLSVPPNIYLAYCQPCALGRGGYTHPTKTVVNGTQSCQ